MGPRHHRQAASSSTQRCDWPPVKKLSVSCRTLVGVRESTVLLEETNHLVRPILDEMYDSGRGVQPIYVAVNPAFIEAVQELQELLRAQLGGAAETRIQVELTAALGPERVRCAAPSSFASMRRRTRDLIAVGMTGSRLSCGSMRLKIGCEDFPGERAAWATVSWPSATTVRSESLGGATRSPSGCARREVSASHRSARRRSRSCGTVPRLATSDEHCRSYCLRLRCPSPLRGRQVPQRSSWPCPSPLPAGWVLWSVFGLVRYPSVSQTGSPSGDQVGAAVLGVGLTVFFLELAGSHHAPAAATALLITTGLAKPGAPLIGLVLGLAIVIAFGPLIGRIPLARRASTADRSGSQYAAGRGARSSHDRFASG